MTKSQELMQAYNQLRGRLASDPQREVMQQRLAGTAPTITAQELYSQPLFPSSPEQVEKQRISARENLAQTGEGLTSLFKALVSNSSGSPFVVGDIASQTENQMLGLAEEATQNQAEIDADKARLIKRVQSGGLSGSEAQGKLNVINQRQERLNRAVEVGQPLIEARKQSGVDFLESIGADPIVKEADLKEKREEAAKVNEQAGVTGGDAEDNTNWFDRLNEKVDLMAMGAAMLAGSSSGKGTAANIGQGLQAGLASRKKEQLQDEAKKRADAMLAIQLLTAKGKGRLTNPQAVGALEAELKVAGAEGDNVNTIANYLYNNPQMNYNMSLLNPTQRQEFLSEFVDIGQGWFGDEIDMDNVIKAGGKAFNRTAGK
jgi:hypothetical protein